jgi:hypothetical protein
LRLAIGNAGHGEELAPVPRGVRQACDGTGVVEKRVRIGDLVAEPELVGDVRAAIACVVDVD